MSFLEVSKMLEVYGIKNCNTVRKSIAWLEINKISYEFFDIKKKVLNESLLNTWISNISSPYTWET